MATGSGKTLVMAGLMLYLYTKGYRNFLFFVNSNNIIQKTKDNFLNQLSSKYLFKNEILIEDKKVLVKEINNFDESDNENINIKFVSIQMLTSGLLLNVSENGLSFEDFEDKRIVLIGDEAHHNNAEVWGDLVEKIHSMSPENILLEFTATLDFEKDKNKAKYEDKIIQKYDLKEFRKDGYSKEINLFRSNTSKEQRIIQALILNLYRQELASKYAINLKPVVLFKAKSTILESKNNKIEFHNLIDTLSIKHIEDIKKTSNIYIIKKAFSFFQENNISTQSIIEKTKLNFKEENCLSANNDSEAELNQIRLNTLEDENNPIRAVFAVQKLNEGWDVLNLFDIVRLYEGQNTGGGNKGKLGSTTISEAQLIGRGARYYPFSLENYPDKYTRKFDKDINNDLKILEELYYHTEDESRYISEIKKALVNEGIYEDDDNFEKKQLTLKLEFKETDFYKNAKVCYNKKQFKDYHSIKSFYDLNITKTNIEYDISSGKGSIDRVFEEQKEQKNRNISIKEKRLAEIPTHIIRYAITKNPFYNFDNVIKYFPNIESISNFIKNKNYLGGLSIRFVSDKKIENISHNDFLIAIEKLLLSIENEIKNNSTEFEGSPFISKNLNEVFTDKEIKIYKDSIKAEDQAEIICDAPWYAYSANYGTSEEKEFVKMFAGRFESLKEKYEDIYLIRNERELKIYDKNGRAFEPDFLLFCKQKSSEQLIFQVFIEPKGTHLIEYDKWKEDFLNNLHKEKSTLKIESDKYVITGVPVFYNSSNNNEFKEQFNKTMNIN